MASPEAEREVAQPAPLRPLPRTAGAEARIAWLAGATEGETAADQNRSQGRCFYGDGNKLRI